ncbi:MAG: hypothetical protein OHK0013_06760 [Sandaracinaceae bacterium]
MTRMLYVLVVSFFAYACEAGGPMPDAGSEGRDAPLVQVLDGGPDDAASDARSGADAESEAGVARLDRIVAVLEGGDEAAIEAAVHDVAWNEGWPLHEEGLWLFVTRLDDRPPSVSLVGHINGWSPLRHPAVRAADGVHFWAIVRDAECDVPAEGSKYKWYVPSDGSFRPPTEATQYGFDEFGRFGWVRAPGDRPHLEQFPAFRSAHLEAPRAFRAYLPAGFVPRSASAARARTLLMHDGQNLFHPDAFFGGWQIDRTLAARGTDVVVVAVDNTSDRMDAYTHTEDDIGRGGPIGGRASDYLALLSNEALPFFRARYGIVARGRSLMMSGSSLGGLVTLVATQRDFESLGCGAALSSTVGWGSIAPGAGGERTLLRTWSGLHAPLYLDSGGGVVGSCFDGDGDGVEDDADDGDNYCVNAQMVRVLEGSGYARGATLAYVWDVGAGHNEAAWAARFAGALDACEAMGWAAP